MKSCSPCFHHVGHDLGTGVVALRSFNVSYEGHAALSHLKLPISVFVSSKEGNSFSSMVRGIDPQHTHGDLSCRNF